MRKLLIGLAATVAAAGVQASTISFNNGSGSYSADGVTASVSTAGGSLYYNNVENAIGVGTTNVNGAMGFSHLVLLVPVFTEAETMTVTFSQAVDLSTIYFRQWENKVLCCGDEVYFDYSGGTSGSGTIKFSNSGLGDGPLIDPFAVGLNLTSFTLRPEQDGSDAWGASNDTAVYLHSLDFTVPVSEVPLPAAAWLFGSALLGLVSIGRRRLQA